MMAGIYTYLRKKTANTSKKKKDQNIIHLNGNRVKNQNEIGIRMFDFFMSLSIVRIYNTCR